MLASGENPQHVQFLVDKVMGLQGGKIPEAEAIVTIQKVKDRCVSKPEGAELGGHKGISMDSASAALLQIKQRFAQKRAAAKPKPAPLAVQQQRPTVGTQRAASSSAPFGMQQGLGLNRGIPATALNTPAPRGPLGHVAGGAAIGAGAGAMNRPKPPGIQQNNLQMLKNAGLFGQLLDQQAQQEQKKAAQGGAGKIAVPWQDEYEIDSSADEPGVAAKKRRGGGRGGGGGAAPRGERKPRVGKEEAKWQEILQEADRAGGLAGAAVRAPLVAIEKMPERTQYRSDKWPEGHSPKYLTRRERQKLYELYHRFGEPADEISAEIKEINDRIGDYSRACAGRDDLEKMKKTLEKEKLNLLKAWDQAVASAKLGSDVGSGPAEYTGDAVIAPGQCLGYRVYHAMAQVGERKYLGPPRIDKDEARADWAVLQPMVTKDESNYNTYLRTKKALFEPDQYQILLANSLELNSAAVAAKQRARGNKDTGGLGSPEDSPENSEDAPVLAMKSAAGGAMKTASKGSVGSVGSAGKKAKAATKSKAATAKAKANKLKALKGMKKSK
eukprot:g7664.t1